MRDTQQRRGGWGSVFLLLVGVLLFVFGGMCVLLGAYDPDALRMGLFLLVGGGLFFWIGMRPPATRPKKEQERRVRQHRATPPKEEPEADREAPSTGDDSENGGAGS